MSAAEATVRFNTDRDEQAMSALLTDLTAKGLGVSQFRELLQDLEDAFLSVTGDKPTGFGKRPDDRR